jgi:hypothetical protein
MSRRKRKGRAPNSGQTAVIIPFPVQGGPLDDEIEGVDAEIRDLVTDEVDLSALLDPPPPCVECGESDGRHLPECITLTEYVEVSEDDYEPTEFAEADGRWVWQPAEDAPQVETPVGWVAHKIRTQCRWLHRHYEEKVPVPQACCYSVLITTARLPGPVRAENHWLVPLEETPENPA